QGLAGAYREPGAAVIDSYGVLRTVTLRSGSSGWAWTWSAPLARPLVTACAASAVATPPEEPRCRTSGSVDQHSYRARTGPHSPFSGAPSRASGRCSSRRPGQTASASPLNEPLEEPLTEAIGSG